ncbi:MAG: recombinase family protein [Firmicutes bacterium]|nr:recombinase family protein [Bacillota bacterium]
MNRTYGYGRVSSKSQNEARQIKALIDNGVDENFIFIDKQSGKDFNREQYQILKHALRENDLLVIQSIDRLGRNYEMIVEEWRTITKDIKADIQVLDMPLLDTRLKKDLLGTFINDLILGLLSYVAHTEREKIKTRQREGIEVARLKGVKFGRKRINKPDNWNEVIMRWKNNEITARESMKLLGLKQTTFYKLLREENLI